jgi:transcriptional regulator with XRE-family HTH domain
VSDKSFDEVLGKRLAEVRRSLAISQEYLATMLRKDQTFVSKVETGKRSLTVHDFVGWSKALNLSEQELSELWIHLKKSYNE